MGNIQIKINPIDTDIDTDTDINTNNYSGINNTENGAKLLGKSQTNKKKYILGIIDPQNDFLKGGALSVDDADSVLAPINKLRFKCLKYMDTFLSQDFHPQNHMSFATTHNVKISTKKELTLTMENGDTINVTQDMWPSHCIVGTSGSEFSKDLIRDPTDKVFQKGTKTNVESYSAFGDEFENKYENTGLDIWLKSKNTTDIVLVGIATDFCVYNTTLDAIRLGYSVHLIRSCTRGVTVDTTNQAYKDMISKKVHIYDDVDDFYKLNEQYFKI